jgi:DNA-binding beta-propeller fold protein YncE
MRLLALLLFMNAGAGCAASWGINQESAARETAWQDHAGTPIIRHVTTMTGFKEAGTAASGIIRSLVFGANGGNAISRPVAIAIGPGERMAIADVGCQCVHLYIPRQHRYHRILDAQGEELKSPVGVAFDNESRLYVSDSARGAVFLFDADGGYLSSITGGRLPLKRPTGLAHDNDSGTLYVVDTLEHAVNAFDRNGRFLHSFGVRGSGNGEFNYPTYIQISPSGRLVVTDAMNFRIQLFDRAGHFLSSFGKHGDGSGNFAMPKGAVIDRDGVYYVVDSLFDNIQLFNDRGDFLLTVGSRGTGHGEFWLPSGLFLDINDKLYVCDTYNQRVQILQIQRSGHE